ncbi:hypothetical protein ACFFLM_03215 [Deinococcus oregonensis]|uniref:Uncharacterized protein n=1 Tax=Deinococcus oregonensis TaxID=1805970 RepID=A0ABV6AU04_9DEIO
MAPFVQSASWSVLALGLLVAAQAAGALGDEAGAVTLSVMALVTHRLGLRRGPAISAFSLSAAGILAFSGVMRLLADQMMDSGRTAQSLNAVSWLPLATWSALGIWALLYTPTGRRLWTARTAKGSLPRMPLRILRAPVIAAGLAVAVLSLAALVPGGAVTAPLLTLGSLGRPGDGRPGRAGGLALGRTGPGRGTGAVGLRRRHRCGRRHQGRADRRSLLQQFPGGQRSGHPGHRPGPAAAGGSCAAPRIQRRGAGIRN